MVNPVKRLVRNALPIPLKNQGVSFVSDPSSAKPGRLSVPVVPRPAADGRLCPLLLDAASLDL